ncbi:MAG: hypothetical protein ACRCXH_14310, partial [Shewanella sp.]
MQQLLCSMTYGYVGSLPNRYGLNCTLAQHSIRDLISTLPLDQQLADAYDAMRLACSTSIQAKITADEHGIAADDLVLLLSY